MAACRVDGCSEPNLVQHNGEKILQFLQEKHCCKILNNNQQLIGPWLDACSYVANDMLPRLKEAGLKYLAWVYSPNVYSQYSADKVLEAASLAVKDQVNFFYSLTLAQEWLQSVA
jgi:hypothetical protein